MGKGPVGPGLAGKAGPVGPFGVAGRHGTAGSDIGNIQMTQNLRSRSYGHFCPVSRSLEVVGERWALLIVRDLMRGPMRFTDLRRSLNSITPKGLTRRLRELERDGVIERESVEGRREVWYRLTAKGQALEQVIGALAIWGFQHALTPPRPDEAIHPARGVWGIARLLQHRNVAPPEPVTWVIDFGDGAIFHITYRDGIWQAAPGAQQADIAITTNPRQWATAIAEGFDQLPASDRPAFDGDQRQIERFKHLFEVYRQAQ